MRFRGQGLADALGLDRRRVGAPNPARVALANRSSAVTSGAGISILYNRVRHESQKWGIDHAPEVDPFAADSITVVKGAGGIRYGPDAIGGVVLIDPPPLPQTPKTGSRIGGEVHAIGVSNGLRGTTATRLEGAHAKLPGFGWRIEANGTRSAALSTPEYPLDNTGSRICERGGNPRLQPAWLRD